MADPQDWNEGGESVGGDAGDNGDWQAYGESDRDGDDTEDGHRTTDDSQAYDGGRAADPVDHGQPPVVAHYQSPPFQVSDRPLPSISPDSVQARSNLADPMEADAVLLGDESSGGSDDHATSQGVPLVMRGSGSADRGAGSGGEDEDVDQAPPRNRRYDGSAYSSDANPPDDDGESPQQAPVLIDSLEGDVSAGGSGDGGRDARYETASSLVPASLSPPVHTAPGSDEAYSSPLASTSSPGHESSELQPWNRQPSEVSPTYISDGRASATDNAASETGGSHQARSGASSREAMGDDPFASSASATASTASTPRDDEEASRGLLAAPGDADAHHATDAVVTHANADVQEAGGGQVVFSSGGMEGLLDDRGDASDRSASETPSHRDRPAGGEASDTGGGDAAVGVTTAVVPNPTLVANEAVVETATELARTQELLWTLEQQRRAVEAQRRAEEELLEAERRRLGETAMLRALEANRARAAAAAEAAAAEATAVEAAAAEAPASLAGSAVPAHDPLSATVALSPTEANPAYLGTSPVTSPVMAMRSPPLSPLVVTATNGDLPVGPVMVTPPVAGDDTGAEARMRALERELETLRSRQQQQALEGLQAQVEALRMAVQQQEWREAADQRRLDAAHLHQQNVNAEFQVRHTMLLDEYAEARAVRDHPPRNSVGTHPMGSHAGAARAGSHHSPPPRPSSPAKVSPAPSPTGGHRRKPLPVRPDGTVEGGRVGRHGPRPDSDGYHARDSNGYHHAFHYSRATAQGRAGDHGDGSESDDGSERRQRFEVSADDENLPGWARAGLSNAGEANTTVSADGSGLPAPEGGDHGESHGTEARVNAADDDDDDARPDGVDNVDRRADTASENQPTSAPPVTFFVVGDSSGSAADAVPDAVRRRLDRKRQKFLEEQRRRREADAAAAYTGFTDGISSSSTATATPARSTTSATTTNNNNSSSSSVSNAVAAQTTGGEGREAAADRNTNSARRRRRRVAKTPARRTARAAHVSNRPRVRNAIQYSCLAGYSNRVARAMALQTLDESGHENFVVLLRRQPKLGFLGLYAFRPGDDTAAKIHGRGPTAVTTDMIEAFFKYDSGAKAFRELSVSSLGATIDGVALKSEFLIRGRRRSHKR